MSKLIEAIHDTAGRVVLAITGGGSTALSRLLAVPGASRTVIEGTVPYDPAALANYLGGPPDQACSGKTARTLAMAAFQRAQRYESGPDRAYGVGCSAALVTDRDRRGTDRCFVAVQSISETTEYSLVLSREHRDRSTQEQLCADVIIHAVARTFGLESAPPVLVADELLTHHAVAAPPGWQHLMSGDAASTPHQLARPALIFPGAFNPLHDGHREMIRVAERITGDTVLLEISAFNVDKPPLDYIEMKEREGKIAAEYNFTFTSAPTFVTKASLFTNATFIVGADTLARIGDPHYYNDSVEARDQAMQAISASGTHFLVFGRNIHGRFTALHDIEMPSALRDMSTGVGEDEFRNDISSTEIRDSSPPGR